jgi:TonB family protein
MSSILKETENLVLPAATPSAPAAVPGTSAAKNSADEQKSSQPVALEIPVTVNGARTVEGSDKREPFSESTKTVLVFGHGAVVRISSPLAPGQLIFLTNEKTKKEVVCQVVKSKSQGPSNGYVELKFTESAPGYWGMRFPAGNATPAAVAPPRPVAPPSPKPVASVPVVVPSSVSPAIPPAPISVTPTVVAPVAPPVTAKKEIAPEQEKVASPAILQEVPPVVEAAKTVEPASVEVSVEKIPPAKTESVTSSSAELPAQSVAPANVLKIAIPENPSLDDLAKQLTKELLKDSAKEPVSESKAPEVIATEVPKELPKEALKEAPEEAVKEIPVSSATPSAKAPEVTSNEPTSEELKQKAVQLQAELSSFLFADSSGKKSDSSSSMNESPSQIAPEPSPAPPVNSKPSSLLQKPLAQSIEVEEVKIPSWLAPLARETDFRSSEQTTDTAKSEAAAESANAEDDAEISAISSEDVARKHQATMFGGQLITDNLDVPQASRASKKGLWIGIAAAALLLAGGAWYANQPDNLLSGIFSPAKPVPARKAAAVETNDSSSTPFRNEISQSAAAGHTSPAATSNVSVNSNIAAPIPSPNSTNATAAVSFPAPKNSIASPASTTSKAVPVPEQPKKPVFGDVHLATPNVKHSGGSIDAGDAEPNIENNASVASPDALNTLAGAHRSGPAIPLPVGGEVKQAKLLKTVPPVYPPTAKTQHVSGDVKLDALIDANGKVTSAKVISGPVLLHQAAAEAVKQWQYDPAQLNGKPTSMHLTVTVQFRLQ